MEKEVTWMKSLSLKLGVILIGLFIFTYEEVWGEDWKKFAESEKIFCCYDAESLTHFDGESLSQPSKNIIQVWVKFKYSDIGLADPVLVKKFKKKINELDESKLLYEINCPDRKYRILESMYYSKDGNVLRKDSIPSNWKHIVRDSLNGALHKAVCK
jgi:hypothetical protein